jgi:hypothetical protein
LGTVSVGVYGNLRPQTVFCADQFPQPQSQGSDQIGVSSPNWVLDPDAEQSLREAMLDGGEVGRGPARATASYRSGERDQKFLHQVSCKPLHRRVITAFVAHSSYYRKISSADTAKLTDLSATSFEGVRTLSQPLAPADALDSAGAA